MKSRSPLADRRRCAAVASASSGWVRSCVAQLHDLSRERPTISQKRWLAEQEAPVERGLHDADRDLAEDRAQPLLALLTWASASRRSRRMSASRSSRSTAGTSRVRFGP